MMYFDIRALLVLACVCTCACGAGWSWPAGAESVRIDTKVRFVDDEPAPAPPDKGKRSEVQSDEAPFRPPVETEGFYNRPPGAAGRYPVRVRVEGSAAYRVDQHAVYPVSTAKSNDGTIDSVQYCKCVSTPDCNPRHDSAEVCGAGKYLCCYKRPNKLKQHNTEFFNEIDDERPMLYPGKEDVGGPFPPPPGSELGGVFGPGHGHDAVLLGAVDQARDTHVDDLFADARKPSLVGPSGPTGRFGPPPVLTGPGGPTGIIGPAPVNTDNRASAQRNVLVGPGGPTGIIGPYNQRPVLVGPGGPTGIIGPNRGGSRGVLVGPGGPTGIIGPSYSRQQRPGLLVGPGGPTGIIGPGRQLLVGPGGPTGHIGPQRYFGN
ncbi:collagen alpha-1(I) chain-like isoform X2 [Pectinophora gossypiella]|uniref:collagen alpha-1(I) chain-like isoform X2 n=1 Tax=Pectinophora gossypiella TaxID=13191 RepID=UPI00214F2013|nr:collagen alpha-1(I) chain-like isoform X2 [Pectinophora gossypiella]